LQERLSEWKKMFNFAVVNDKKMKPKSKKSKPKKELSEGRAHFISNLSKIAFVLGEYTFAGIVIAGAIAEHVPLSRVIIVSVGFTFAIIFFAFFMGLSEYVYKHSKQW
jgi:uncharacterized membrane protein YraQ (UPF0718 family)